MSRMLDRNQYDPRMITNVEIMTAYFVDIFYNHLYFEGKKLKASGNVVSVTEGYKHALNAFIKSLSNPKLYKKAVIGIHQYFLNYTSFTTISFAKCVDRIAANFVPVDYYASLDNTQKMSILRLVINQAIKTFTKKVVNDHLAKIIDNHQEADNVRLLQDELVDVFLLEREAVYQRFISSQTHTRTDETVNRLVSEKMQHEIKNLILEKIQLKKENEALKKIIVKNNEELSRLREASGNIESELNELKAGLPKQQASAAQPRAAFTYQPASAPQPRVPFAYQPSFAPQSAPQPPPISDTFMPVTRRNLLQSLDPHESKYGGNSDVTDFIRQMGGMEITEVLEDSDGEGESYIHHESLLEYSDDEQQDFPDPPKKEPESTKALPLGDAPKALPLPKPEQSKPDPPKKDPRPVKSPNVKPTVPKKKRPSSEMGDEITLDAFY
jgi:hypothetical protein